MNKPKILVILGSVRENRSGEQVATWAMSHLNQRQDASFELVDLKELNLPDFDFGGFPSMVKDSDYGHSLVNRWAEKVKSADGYIIINSEYNHGYSSSLKNSLDWIYSEWNNKSVGFISYGNIAGGSRSTEQLRQVVAELQMADVRTAVHIPNVWAAFNDKGELNDASLAAPLDAMVDQVVAWANALKQLHASVKAEAKEYAEASR